MEILFVSPYQYEVSVSVNGFAYDFISNGPAVLVDASVSSLLLNNPYFTAA